MEQSSSSSSLIPCTVHVLTHNSAGIIEPCLRSLSAFAQVLVHDGHSTDGTRDIAARFPNVTVSLQSKELLDESGRIMDFAAVRNEGLRGARFPWILQVDAETLSPGFVEDVRAAVSGDAAVYQVSRRFYLHGERIDWCAGYPSLQIRLFHRSCTDGYTKAVHERLILHPGIVPRTLPSELPEDVPSLQSLPTKNAYYRSLERRRLGHLPWGRWFRHVLYRNLRTISFLLLRIASIWLIPRRGKRMPLVYEFSYIGQQLCLIKELCPAVSAKNVEYGM